MTARSKPRSASRGLVKAEINHVLIAACKDSQTAADATIESQPNGAFTYYLCKTLRAGGPNLDRQALIDEVENALAEGQFNQVPQLETATSSGPLFGSKRGTTPPTSPPSSTPSSATPNLSPVASLPVGPGGDQPSVLEVLSKIVGPGGTLDPGAQRQALDILSRIVAGAPTKALAAMAGREAAGRFLVAVHGICEHPPGYSNPWWDALHPWTTVFGDGTLGDTRREVQWSDIVHRRALSAVADATAADRAEFAARVRGVLEDRTASQGFQRAGTAAAARDLLARDLSATRGLSIPGIECINDFTVYMFDDSIRAQIVGRFTSVVGELLRSGAEIDIISHSWGTVVSYEGLRELEDGGLSNPLVRNYFTVGAALSIFPVKMRLRPANRDGHKPAMVRRWINLNAKGDPVGGPLQGQPYEVDEEDLDLPNLGCGFFDAGCAHGSYFTVPNVQVNRDIFARNINSA
jgi:hypothetical protein